MKKLLSGLIAAFLLSTGFVAVSGGVASAAPSARACTPSKYVKCPPAATQASAPRTVRRNKAAKVRVVIRTQGSVKPKGTVTLVIKGPGGFRQTIKKAYNGKPISAGTKKFKKKGTYTVTITFNSSNTKSPTKKTIRIRVR